MRHLQSSLAARGFLLAALVAGLAAGGCTPHRTGATEVGVRFNKVTKTVEEYPAGATYFFAPLINDWKTYDVGQRNLLMTAEAGSGDRKGKDDLRFKTRDGNDIETDVSVRWRIDPTKIGTIWKDVAPSTDQIEQRVVRPMARTYVRDALNRLESEKFYDPTERFKAAQEATERLKGHMASFGVIVEQVLLGNFSFKKDYQELINSRKEAEKTAEKLEAQILATKEENQAKLQGKIAELTEKLTRAQGEFEQSKRGADAYLVQRRQGAQATLAERTATAQGIQRERAALNSSAGDAYVSLQLIEALQKKEIRQIPKLPSGNVIVDGNKLLEQLGVIQYRERQEKDKP